MVRQATGAPEPLRGSKATPVPLLKQPGATMGLQSGEAASRFESMRRRNRQAAARRGGGSGDASGAHNAPGPPGNHLGGPLPSRSGARRATPRFRPEMVLRVASPLEPGAHLGYACSEQIGVYHLLD